MSDGVHNSAAHVCTVDAHDCARFCAKVMYAVSMETCGHGQLTGWNQPESLIKDHLLWVVMTNRAPAKSNLVGQWHASTLPGVDMADIRRVSVVLGNRGGSCRALIIVVG